jgi:twitching motility protein PilI
VAEVGPEVRGGGSGERLLGRLRDIEARCLSNAAGLPQQTVAEPAWEGVLFSVAGRLLVAPLGEVKEILNHPSAVTPVPGTHPWVVWVANIRGNLLPIVDLQSFLLQRQTIPGRRSRVLVVDHQGVYSGLLVDAMVGIRHFYPSQRSARPTALPEAIGRFVDIVYEHADGLWPVFSMCRLAESAEFQFAAA